MNIASFVLKKFLLPRARVFENATKNPMEAQKKVLFEYLRRNRRTKYGTLHGFAGIKSINEYRTRVPLCNSEKLTPYIDSMKNGEHNVLTADRTVYFGITSGTTGRPKFIPVTKYSRNKKADVMKLWTFYTVRDHPGVISGKILAIIDPEIKGFTEGGLPYGPENGHAYNNLPAIVKRLYALPYEIFSIRDYDARYYCILRLSLEHNITTLATLNPNTIILLCEKIREWQERLISDIEKGTLNQTLNIPADTRKILERAIRPNPKRAAELRSFLEKRKELLPGDFWPGMKLIECWKGGTVSLYLKDLPRYFPHIPVRGFGCLSTEARSSIPISDIGAGGILAINTNFYEFIPREDIFQKNKRVLLCDQLEKGKEYLLIVTTPGGLYRYDMDDVIRVDGFFNRTPVIEFVQKGLNAISVTGEKVYESHINNAVSAAVDEHNISVRFFTSTIEMRTPPRYVFLVEFITDLPLEKKKLFLRSIEKELCRQNAEYEDIRNQQLLGPPVLRVMKEGEGKKYRLKRISEGAHDGQFKVPKLTGDPDFHKNFSVIEEIQAD